MNTQNNFMGCKEPHSRGSLFTQMDTRRRRAVGLAFQARVITERAFCLRYIVQNSESFLPQMSQLQVSDATSIHASLSVEGMRMNCGIGVTRCGPWGVRTPTTMTLTTLKRP
jgi:hypothetical protein